MTTWSRRTLGGSPRWATGVSDVAQVRTCPLTAGVFGYDDEVGRTGVRVLAFLQQCGRDLPWAHRSNGVVAHVDATSGTVLRVIETDAVHVA